MAATFLSPLGRAVPAADAEMLAVEAAPDDTDAPVALTAATVATANGSDPATTQALANALKTELNKVIADNVALRGEVATLTTAHNDLVAALTTAGVFT